MSQGGSRELLWVLVCRPQMILVAVALVLAGILQMFLNISFSVHFPTSRDVLGRFLVRF